jgi:hypothetical protein
MRTRIAFIATLLAVLALVPGLRHPGLTAASPAQQTPATGAGPQPQSNMPDMMKMHEQMMTEMKAGDARLDALIQEMNSATGEPKINAVAAVVSELVRQQKSMHGRMGQMHELMMGGRGMMMKQ